MRCFVLVFSFFVLFSATSVAAPVDTKKYVWSYAVVADVTNDMFKYCSKVQLPELTKHGDFLAANNAYVSKAELVRKCITEVPFFDVIDMNKKDCKEHMIIPGTIYSVKGKKSDGCNLFITNLIDRQAKLKAMYISPGTYVSETVLDNGKKVYKVDNVVLAAGCRDSAGNTNNDVNTSDSNTHIYKLDGTKYVKTNMHTWTNDMFMNVQNGNGDKGMIRGARVGAYIYYDEDMTERLYDAYNERRGKIGSSVLNAWDSRPGGTLDIKEHYRDTFKVADQSNGAADGNGFVFRGKIATLDFLGNVLYGMNAQEASLSNDIADWMADRVSNYSTPGVNKLKAVAGKEGDDESQWVKTGWQIGKDMVSGAKESRDLTFKHTQTATPQEAYDIARRQVLVLYPNAENIKCSGNCKGYGGDDIVICLFSDNVLEFVFDDICNGKSVNVPSNMEHSVSHVQQTGVSTGNPFVNMPVF